MSELRKSASTREWDSVRERGNEERSERSERNGVKEENGGARELHREKDRTRCGVNGGIDRSQRCRRCRWHGADSTDFNIAGCSR